MRRSLLAPLLITALAAPVLALATGFGGTDAPTRIPLPARVFNATVEDISGTSVEVTRVSINGEVSLYGFVGEGQVAIPFEKLVDVRVEPSNDPKHRIVLAKTTSGENIRVTVDSDVPCYGDTTYGHYKIDFEKLRKITFKPSP